MRRRRGLCHAICTRVVSTKKMSAPRSDPEREGHLLEVVDGRSGDLRVEEEGGSLHLLADDEAHGGEHREAAVRDLDVRVPLRLRLVDVLEEAEEVDAVLEGGARLEESRIHRGANVGVRLAGAGDRGGDAASLLAAERARGETSRLGSRGADDGGNG